MSDKSLNERLEDFWCKAVLSGQQTETADYLTNEYLKRITVGQGMLTYLQESTSTCIDSVKETISNGRKIDAIKEYRYRFPGTTLQDAKLAVEALMREMGL